MIANTMLAFDLLTSSSSCWGGDDPFTRATLFIDDVAIFSSETRVGFIQECHNHETSFCMHGRAYCLNNTLCFDGPVQHIMLELKLLVVHVKDKNLELLNLSAGQSNKNERQNSLRESRFKRLSSIFHHNFFDMTIWALERSGRCYEWIPR